MRSAIPLIIGATLLCSCSTTPSASSYRDAVYSINGTPVTLSQVQYFGNEAWADLNGDGTDDVVFLLTQDNGGSGTFYYVVAALSDTQEYKGTNAVFLGDRIAPQTTEIRNDGTIIVNYTTRKDNEPMTTQPRIGVSRYLKITNGELVEE